MEFVSEDTCKISVGVYLNSNGNIVQGDETPVSQKTFTFKIVRQCIMELAH